jgi:hypothetical protein
MDTTMSDDELGKLISVYKAGMFRYWYCFLLSGLLFLLLWMLASHRNADEPNDVYVLIAITIAAVIPLLIAWYYSINEVRIHERGFEYNTRRRTIAARWDEIKHIYSMSIAVNASGIPTAPQHRFSLWLNDGTIVRFSPRLENVQDLGAVLYTIAEQRGMTIQRGVPYSFSREPSDGTLSIK